MLLDHGPCHKDVLFSTRREQPAPPLCFPKECQVSEWTVSLLFQIAVKTMSMPQRSLSHIFITGDFSKLNLLLCCRKKRGEGRVLFSVQGAVFHDKEKEKRNKKCVTQNQAKPNAQRIKCKTQGRGEASFPGFFHIVCQVTTMLFATEGVSLSFVFCFVTQKPVQDWSCHYIE